MAEQVKVELVVTPLLGLIDTLATTGSLFPTLTLSALTTLPPSASVAVAVQVIESLGDAVELDRVILEPAPIVLEPLLQM